MMQRIGFEDMNHHLTLSFVEGVRGLSGLSCSRVELYVGKKCVSSKMP